MDMHQRINRFRTKLSIKRRLWRFAFIALPQPLIYELWHRRQRQNPRMYLKRASSLKILNVSGAQLAVYWVDTAGVGSGPTASLYVYEEEVLRLDCFGDDRGHMHFNPQQCELFSGESNETIRIYFPVGSRKDHVDRAAFELQRNVPTALQMNGLARIRNYQLKKVELALAAEQMHQIMMTLLQEDEQRLSEDWLPQSGNQSSDTARIHQNRANNVSLRSCSCLK